MFKGIKIAVVWVVFPVIIFGCVVQSEHNLACIRMQDAQMEHMRTYHNRRVESLEDRILKLQFMLDTVELTWPTRKRTRVVNGWILSDRQRPCKHRRG